VATVLVVEDEERIRHFVQRALQAHGYHVETAENGAEGMGLALFRSYDLVVLDLMLPGLSGMDLLPQLLRHRPEQRVLVLSAVPDVETRVRALELGAADFLMKPFAVEELIARIRTRLRTSTENEVEPTSLTCNGLKLDLGRQTLLCEGRTIPLSQREFKLLAHLMTRVGEVCSRQDLLAEVWGYTFDPGSNVVDVYVRRLRSKLDDQRIETVRNVGYCLLAS
jgi:two-component system OmpR family response regulator